MSRWVIIAVLIVVLLVGAMALVYFTSPAAAEALGAVVEPVAGGLERVVNMTSGIMQRAAVVAAVFRARGMDARFAGALLAVYRNESDLDPWAFNYYETANGKKKLRRGKWDGDPATLPDGSGGKPNAWAVGVGQIIRPNREKTGLTLADAFDPAANIEWLLTNLNGAQWTRILAALPDADLQLQTALLYLGHAEGGGPLNSALAAIAAGGADWTTATAGVEAEWGGRNGRPASGFYNNSSKMWLVGSYAQWWADQYAAGLGGDGAA